MWENDTWMKSDNELKMICCMEMSLDKISQFKMTHMKMIRWIQLSCWMEMRWHVEIAYGHVTDIASRCMEIWVEMSMCFGDCNLQCHNENDTIVHWWEWKVLMNDTWKWQRCMGMVWRMKTTTCAKMARCMKMSC